MMTPADLTALAAAATAAQTPGTGAEMHHAAVEFQRLATPEAVGELCEMLKTEQRRMNAMMEMIMSGYAKAVNRD